MKFEGALNSADPWFKPSNCEQFNKNLLAVSGTNREKTIYLVAAWAQSLACARVCNILSMFEGLGVLSRLLLTQESVVHVWVTCRICPFVLCKGYSVQGYALPSLVLYKFRLCCQWSAEFQLYSCWLAAVSWIPPSTKLPARNLVYIQAKVPCFAGRQRFFPQMSLLPSHFLLKLIFY